MLKYMALSILVVSSVNSMELLPNQIQASHRLGDLSVSLSDEGFKVNDSLVQRYNMDKDLRDIKRAQLARLLTAGSYIAVNQSNDNEYSLLLQQRLQGGGLGGAWFGANAGYWGVKIVGYGAFIGVTTAMDIAVPGTGTAFGLAIQAPYVAAVESLSTYAALCGGAAGGVATGLA